MVETKVNNARQARWRWLVGPALFVLSWGAIRPILRTPIPHADDLAFHLHRIVQLNHLLDQGIVFSRWAPDLARGYGYPLFNFQFFAPYYLAQLFRPFTDDPVRMLQLTFALGVVVAGWGMYLLAHDHVSRPAAFVAAVALMYAPYFAYDVLFRGNLGESTAWLWMPLGLWAIGRIARGAGRWWIAVAALCLAGITVTHNLFALLFSPIFGLYGIVELLGSAWPLRGQGRTLARRLAGVVGAIALGLGLSAFFWLPALLESSDTAVERLLATPGYSVTDNFLTLGELVALPGWVFRDLLNPSPGPALGLVTLALAGACWLGARRMTPALRRQAAFFSAAALLIVFLLFPISSRVWQAVPLLDLVQFPWRLLGPAALCLAFLSGVTVELIAARWRIAVSLAAMTLLVVAAQSWLNPSYGPRPATVTLDDVLAYEAATQTLATTVRGENLPRTVLEVPPTPPETWFDLADGVVVDERREPLSAEARLQLNTDQAVTVNIFDFAGWQATVDGEPVEITPSVPFGLITVPVPAGEHTVAVRFGTTPLRMGATIVSLVSAVMVVGLLWHSWRRSDGRNSAEPIDPLFLLLALGFGVALFAVTPLLASDRLQPDGSLAGVAPTRIPFDDGMVLLGVEGVDGPVSADTTVDLTLYWTADQTPQHVYWTTVALRDADGVLWSDKSSSAPPRFRRAIPTNAWSPDSYATDRHQVSLFPGTPPATYELVVTVFDKDTLAPLPQRATTTTQVPIGTVVVERPREQPVFTVSGEASSAETPLQLIDFSVDRVAAQPGDDVLVSLWWQVNEATLPELTMRLMLGAQVIAERMPVNRFPTSAMADGDRWLGQHLVRLPAAAADGPAQLAVVVCDSAECDPPIILDTLTVDAPERLTAPPELPLPVNGTLSDSVTLVSAEVVTDAGSLGVTLLWQALRTPETRYRVFVHLLDAAGALLAQSDGEPANWQRPTTGWLPGEFILDRHTLPSAPLSPAPSGSRLVVGLYDPATGERLTLPTGEDAITVWSAP